MSRALPRTSSCAAPPASAAGRILIIIDGVIVRSGLNSGGGSSTLSDIAGEDIERVEVVKAPRRPRSTVPMRPTASSRSSPARRQPGRRQARSSRAPGWCVESAEDHRELQAHAFRLNPDGSYFRNASGARVYETTASRTTPIRSTGIHQAEVIDGQFYNAYFSIGQRKGNTNFNASFQSTKNEGVIFGLNGYERQNYRINVDQQLAQRLDASFSAFCGTSSNRRAAEGPGSAFFGLTFVEPDTDILAQCTKEQVDSGTCTKEIGNPDGSPYRAFIPDKLSNATNLLYNLTNQQSPRTATVSRVRFARAGGCWTGCRRKARSTTTRSSRRTRITRRSATWRTPVCRPTATWCAQFWVHVQHQPDLSAVNTWGKINNTTKLAYLRGPGRQLPG